MVVKRGFGEFRIEVGVGELGWNVVLRFLFFIFWSKGFFFMDLEKLVVRRYFKRDF